MSVLGHGVDLVEIARIGDMLANHPHRFPERVFTPAERAESLPPRRRAEFLAGRFAAKEAVLKALGTGLSHGITWTDVEIVPDDSGRPRVFLHHAAAERARVLGVRDVLLSISHTRTHALASAIAAGG